MIEVRNLTKTFGKKPNLFTALHKINLKIDGGSSVAIVGKSGSGKSTLMHVISGLESATDGEVIIDGKNIAKMNQKQTAKFRNKQIGFVFQSFFVEANQSVLDNISLPLEIAKISPRRRKQLAQKALKSVGLSSKMSNKARNLSGGQKQRLAVARAIVNQPKILFADEPTGNLDSVTGQKIIELLFELNRDLNATLVIVTHDQQLAELCDSQIELKDGRVHKITSKNKPKKPAKNKTKLGDHK